jgi:hypothetical protein
VVDPAKLYAAGGEVGIFARATRHPLVPTTQIAQTKAAGRDVEDWSFNLQLDAKNLDLNELIHAGAPSAHNQPGRLAARISLVGDPEDRRRFYGDGEARLTQSDLADNTVISALYAALSVKLGPKKPTGTGRITLRLEGEDLDVTSFYYFNRGVEARGAGQIHEIWKGGDAQPDAYVIGSARPLKDLKLPFAADVDKILSVVQHDVTTVRVGGAVSEPRVKLAAFGEIGQALRAIILSDVKSETRSTPGQ